ncbi:Phosphorylated adapter RNA export protein [Halotydeus destructor]|nr:Phosphorylated adapter RNA export protein [Halotydeus destructor]
MDIFARGMKGSDADSDNEFDKMMAEPLDTEPVAGCSNSLQLATFSKPKPSIVHDAVSRPPKAHKKFSLWSDLLMEEKQQARLSRKHRSKGGDVDGNGYCKRGDDVKKASIDKPNHDALKHTELVTPQRKKKKHKKKKRRNSDEQAASKIAGKLMEHKTDLIRKAISIVGAEKCFEICGNALDVEDTGGMMTTNGSRRRTPGGVFFQLLKNDKNISDEQKNKVFEVMETTKISKKYKKRERKKMGEARQALQNFSLNSPDASQSPLSITSTQKPVETDPNADQQKPSSSLELAEELLPVKLAQAVTLS